MSVVLGEHTQFTDNEDGTFIVTLENKDEILYTKYIFGNKEELENHINYIDEGVMNIHIELVKKWLADPASVSQEELKDNRVAAYAADAAAYADAADAAAAAYAAYAADAADAATAAYDAAYAYAADAAYWVKRYEELKEQE